MDSLRGYGSTVATTTRDGIPQTRTHDKARSLPQPEAESAQQDKVSWPTAEQLLALSNEELGRVDLVVMNLAVAKGLPSLAELDIGRYVRLADEWANDLRARMPAWEKMFCDAPDHWRNDIDYLRLGLVAWYVDTVLGVTYRENLLEVKQILYTDPTDLFLNGVMDTRQGTCGNMALLHVVLGRRIGLPVSLACVANHYLCRFDDGSKTINIEATFSGRGGFALPTDEEMLVQFKLPAKAQTCGSDLRALTPREMLGTFFGQRARNLENLFRFLEAEPDYLVARYLFPHNRKLYIAQNLISVQVSPRLFEPGEKGHPIDLAGWLQEVVRVAPWNEGKPPDNPADKTPEPEEGSLGDTIFANGEQIPHQVVAGPSQRVRLRVEGSRSPCPVEPEIPGQTQTQDSKPKEKRNVRHVDAIFQQLQEFCASRNIR
ncbi:MAG: transglutaminase family protein [Thermoguttaceae bacterium]